MLDFVSFHPVASVALAIFVVGCVWVVHLALHAPLVDDDGRFYGES